MVIEKHPEFRIFVEGGDKGKLAQKCREGFGKFFQNAGLGARKPRIVSCGTRLAAYEDFCYALAKAGNKDIYLLLVDSEAAVTVIGDKVWDHVKNRGGDGWKCPAGADAEMLHFMVECMENWLLADPQVLEKYFAKGFKASALPKKADVEKIPKAEAYAALKEASAKSETKGEYSKGEHSFALLTLIDPAKVKGATTFGKRAIEKVQACSNLPIR